MVIKKKEDKPLIMKLKIFLHRILSKIHLLAILLLLIFPPVYKRGKFGGISRDVFPNNYNFLFDIKTHYQIDWSILITEILVILVLTYFIYSIFTNKDNGDL